MVKQFHTLVDDQLFDTISKSGWKYSYIVQRGVEAISGYSHRNDEVKELQDLDEKRERAISFLQRRVLDMQEQLDKLKKQEVQ